MEVWAKEKEKEKRKGGGPGGIPGAKARKVTESNVNVYIGGNIDQLYLLLYSGKKSNERRI